MLRTSRLLMLGLAVGASLAAAMPASLFDPQVTIELAETPLDEALEVVSRQTGLSFTSPFSELQQRLERVDVGNEAGERRMPDLAEVRARMNPNVTVQFTAAPVAEVIADLARQTGFWFQRLEDGSGYRLNFGRPGRDGAGQPGPQVNVDDYLVGLGGLRLERVHELLFGEQARNTAQHRLQVFLTVNPPSELARYALLGLTGEAEAVLDGQLLAPARGPGNQLPGGLARLPGSGEDGYRLEFELPEDAPGHHLDRVAGSLSVIEDLRELVFEFETLQPNEQRQSDGDIDVTVQPASAPAARVEERERGERGSERRRIDEPSVQITISRPATGLAGLAAPGRSSREMFEMRRLGRDVPVANPPPPPEMMGGGFGGEMGGPRLYGRSNALGSVLVPRVAIELPDGGLRLAPVREVNTIARDGRVEISVRAATGALSDEALRIWVAILESDATVKEVPFSIGAVDIPAADPPPPPR